MITVHLGRWCDAAGPFFALRRIYWRGKWTPFCRIRKRYPSWRGYWQNLIKHH